MATTSALVTNTGGNVYVSTGNTAVTWLSLTNYGAANVQANVHVLPSGGTANVQNQIVANIVVTPQDTYQIYVGNEKLILANSETIYIIANVNSALNAVSSYVGV